MGECPDPMLRFVKFVSAFVLAGALLGSQAGASLAYEPGCGGINVVKPKKKVSKNAAPLIIGDSVLLGAMPQLAARGFEVNARGCRGWEEGLALIKQRKRAHHLPHMVAMQLGTNYSISVSQIRRTLIVLGRKRVLMLLTPREVGGYSGSDASHVRQAGRRWPKQVVVLDWARYSSGHGSWFQPDGIHLMPGGARALASLSAQSLRYAAWGKHPSNPKANTAAVSTASPLVATALPAGHRGAVSLKVTGAAGDEITVSERGEIIARGTVGTRPLIVKDVASWTCKNRKRTFIVANAAGASTQVTARTPSCKSRLFLRAPKRLRAGQQVGVRAGNAWATGTKLKAKVCLAPPAARARCQGYALRAGASPRSLRWPASRPGRALLSVRAAGRTYKRTVNVVSRHGRLKVLAAGDSEMQELDAMIRSGLGSRARLHSDARISTGLTNTFFFDWVAHARSQGASYRPDVTVMFIGANDGFPLPAGGRQLPCCSRAWSKALAGRARSMVNSYSRRGAGVVYWFLLPLPRSPDLRRMFRAINLGYQLAAAANPDDMRLIDATKTFTPHGYRNSMRVGDRTITVHQADGYHLSYPAMRIASKLVLEAMRRDRVI